MKPHDNRFYPAVLPTYSPNQYIPALTGLRAIAAYLVFLHHYNPEPSGTMGYALLEQGYMGVSVFFVLSGFLIYHRYAQAYLTQTNWSWRRYIWRRFARIYPLYLLLFLLMASSRAVLHKPMSLGLFWLNVTLLKGFFDSLKFSGIAQSWSLTVEFCFYVSAPLLFTGLQRWGAFCLTAGLVVTGLLAGVIASETLITESFSFIAFYTFFGRAFEFVVGITLARLWQQNALPLLPYPIVIGVCVIGVCLGWQAYFTLWTNKPFYLFISEVLVYSFVLPVGIGLFLLALIQPKTFFGKLLTHPYLQAAGRSSYAFYLIHIGLVSSCLQKAGLTNRWLLFGSLISIAHGLYHFVERPLYRYLVRCPST